MYSIPNQQQLPNVTVATTSCYHDSHPNITIATTGRYKGNHKMVLWQPLI